LSHPFFNRGTAEQPFIFQDGGKKTKLTTWLFYGALAVLLFGQQGGEPLSKVKEIVEGSLDVNFNGPTRVHNTDVKFTDVQGCDEVKDNFKTSLRLKEKSLKSWSF
jgi:ATP-dependent Zn protease